MTALARLLKTFTAAFALVGHPAAGIPAGVETIDVTARAASRAWSRIR
jgi:hypothetical protein